MKTQAIKQLLEAMELGGYQHLDLQLGSERIKLVRGKESNATNDFSSAQEEEAKVDSIETGLSEGPKPVSVLSERVGVFSVGKAPVQNGSEVRKGQTLGVIKGISNPDNVVAPLGGTVREINVKEGDLVEFGRRLFLIQPC